MCSWVRRSTFSHVCARTHAALTEPHTFAHPHPTHMLQGLKSSSTDEADIVLFEGHVAVMRAGSDVHLFVTGDQDENEIILVEVLNTMHEALTSLLGSLDSRRMMDKLEVVQLVIDELVDAGVILEIEASAIVNRVGMRGADAGPGTTSVIGAMQAAAAQSGSGGSAASAAMSFAEQMTRAFKATGTT